MNLIYYLKQSYPYFKKRNFSIWRNDYKPAANLPFPPYYITYLNRFHAGHYDLFNKKGVPLRQYINKSKPVINPTTICSYALTMYELWLIEKKEHWCQKFIIQAEWLASNQQSRQIKDRNFGVWEYNFDGFYNLKAPWCSAMAQGQAISVLVRAAILTQKEWYLQVAERALPVLVIPIKQGGLCTYNSKDLIFFEEYPTGSPPHVLNGFIYTLWGLWDLFKLNGNKDAKFLFEAGIESLRYRLEEYDSGFWSFYDCASPPNIASYLYHTLHIAQLNALAKQTGINAFYEVANRWQMYQQNYLCRFRALSQKIKSKKGH